MEMICEKAEEMGIDIEEGINYPVIAEKQERRTSIAKNEPCYRIWRKYYDTVDKWFDKAAPGFKDKSLELESQLIMELPGAKPVEDANRIKDAADVILWYHHFIGAKLYRALHGRQDEGYADKYGFQIDSDGSAKIALISIDR